MRACTLTQRGVRARRASQGSNEAEAHVDNRHSHARRYSYCRWPGRWASMDSGRAQRVATPRYDNTRSIPVFCDPLLLPRKESFSGTWSHHDYQKHRLDGCTSASQHVRCWCGWLPSLSHAYMLCLTRMKRHRIASSTWSSRNEASLQRSTMTASTFFAEGSSDKRSVTSNSAGRRLSFEKPTCFVFGYFWSVVQIGAASRDLR